MIKYGSNTPLIAAFFRHLRIMEEEPNLCTFNANVEQSSHEVVQLCCLFCPLLISTPLLHKTLLSRCDQTCQDNAGAHPREDGRRHRLSPLRAFLTCLPVLGDKLYLR